VLLLLHVAARRYVDWFDHHNGRDQGIFGSLLTLILLGGSGYQLFQPEPTEETEAAEEGAGTVSK